MRRLTPLVWLLLLVPVRRGDAQGMVVHGKDIQQRATNPAVLAGTRVVRAGRADTLGTNDSVRLRPGVVVAVPTGKRATRDSTAGSAGDAHLDLPVRLLTVDAGGTQVLTLTIRVAPEGAGLTFNRSKQSFAGTVLIGLEDSLRRTQKIALAKMQLQITGDVDSLDRRIIDMDHTNIPWERVQLFARTPRDTVHVRIQAVFDPVGYAAPIPVERPQIEVRPLSPNIQGLGLDEVPVTIAIPQSMRGDTVRVTLWSDRGGLDVATLAVPPSGIAEVGLRSSGVGLNTVHAEIMGIATGEARVRYTLPWPFLVAAFLGGVLGTVIRRRKRHLALADFVAGIVLGLVSAIAYAIGLNLTGIDLNVRVGEAAVLIVAVLGAALELPGLTGLRKRVAGDGG